MLPRSFLWSSLKRACEWMIQWLNIAVESAVHQAFRRISHLCNSTPGYRMCVCCSSNTAFFFLSFFSQTQLWRSCTFGSRKKSKFCHYVVHIVLAFPAWRKGGHSCNTVREAGVYLREALGHSASQAPAGKMRTHLGLDSGVPVYLCAVLCTAVCTSDTGYRSLLKVWPFNLIFSTQKSACPTLYFLMSRSRSLIPSIHSVLHVYLY